MKKFLLLVITSVLFTSCFQEKKVKEDVKIKKSVELCDYYYIDRYKTLHRSDCEALKYCDDLKDLGVFRIKNYLLDLDHTMYCCIDCIDDEEFEMLVRKAANKRARERGNNKE